MSVKQEDGTRWPIHDIAHEFPRMKGGEMDDLSSSWSLIGQVIPGMIWKDPITGKIYIVEGSHRYEMAIQKEEKKWKVIDISCLTAHEMREYVFAANLIRRHLTDDQRAALAAKLLERPAVQAPGAKAPTVRGTAATVNVSRAKVSRARGVGAVSPELLQEVVDGEKTLAAAESEAGTSTPRHTATVPLQAAPPAGGMRVTLQFTIPRPLVLEKGLLDAAGVVNEAAFSAFIRPAYDALLDLEIPEITHYIPQ